jgi:hypothetical protein
MADAIEQLMLANLIDVFNERDADTRKAAIGRTYANDVRWTDDEGVTTGHEALDAKCIGLQQNLGDQQFVADGPVRRLQGFGYLAWHLVDPASGQPSMSGFDVALVADGLITDLWTVLIPPNG